MNETTKSTKSAARQAADAVDRLTKLAATCDARAVEAAVQAIARVRERYSAKARELYDGLTPEVRQLVDQLRGPTATPSSEIPLDWTGESAHRQTDQ